ncbi:hypothetical protein OROHE_013511 [Orobanche hederae]
MVIKIMAKRATWNDNTTKKLLDICIDENSTGSSKFDWGKIAKNLIVQTEMPFVAKQVQNHFEDLKVKYKGWVELKNMSSGIAFNPNTNAVQVEETHLERWNNFKEKHRKYANMLVKKGLQHVNELEKLFAGKSAHGERGFSTAMAGAMRVNGSVEGGEEESVGAVNEMEIDANDAVVDKRKDACTTGEQYSTPPRKRKLQKIVEAQDTIDTVLELLTKVVPAPSVNKTEMVSFALREMGVSKERGDIYFVQAMKYLGEGNNGDIFMALENDNQKMENNIRRACIVVGLEALRRLLRSPKIRRSLRNGEENGAQYIHRLLHGHSDLMKEQIRFRGFILVPEQVGICLYILAKGASYRDAADRFQHSISTVSYYFRKVLDALVTLSFDIVRPHADLSMVPSEIRDNSLYWPFFEDCVGALGGTHIQAVISDNEGIPFRGRKGTKSWNVLACCSFDRIFTFINVGWEGSAHDMTVWADSLTQSKYCFPHPPSGKYYLVDSGYLNTTGYLSPIMVDNARYHIPDFKKNRVLKGVSEQFNYRHSSLQTTVERAFGQLKKRWKLLYVMPQMEEKFQVYVIVAAFTLHNFMRMCKLGIPVVEHGVVQGRADSDLLNLSRKEAMNKLRNKIALRIWRSIPDNMEIDME